MRLWHKCFPVNFAKFLKAFFYKTPPEKELKNYYLILTITLQFFLFRWNDKNWFDKRWQIWKSCKDSYGTIEAATGSVTPVPLLKKRLWHRRFPVNFAKFSYRTSTASDTNEFTQFWTFLLRLINFFLCNSCGNAAWNISKT